MFNPRTPLYLRDVTFRVKDVNGENKKVVDCQFMIQPFKPEMAEELGLRSRLFNMSTGEPDPTIQSAELRINVPLQMLSIAMAPDSGEDRLALRHVRVSSTIRVRRDKEGPVYAATFRVDFDYPTPNELLYLAHGINDQHFCTFATEQDSMLDDEGDEPAAGAGESATAH
jgi:hypothetical protein